MKKICQKNDIMNFYGRFDVVLVTVWLVAAQHEQYLQQAWQPGDANHLPETNETKLSHFSNCHIFVIFTP